MTNAAECAYNVGMDQLAEFRADQLATEGRMLRRTLEAAEWNQGVAARRLGCPRQTLQRAIKRHPELIALIKKHGPKAGRPCKSA